MKIGLYDVDSKIPNLVLMKLSAYHKTKGEAGNRTRLRLPVLGSRVHQGSIVVEVATFGRLTDNDAELARARPCFYLRHAFDEQPGFGVDVDLFEPEFFCHAASPQTYGSAFVRKDRSQRRGCQA